MKETAANRVAPDEPVLTNDAKSIKDRLVRSLWELGERNPDERSTVIQIIQDIDQFARCFEARSDWVAFVIGTRVREVRKKLRMNQDQFANFVGLTQQKLSLLELGKQARNVNVGKIASALSIDIQSLVALPISDLVSMCENKAKKTS